MKDHNVLCSEPPHIQAPNTSRTQVIRIRQQAFQPGVEHSGQDNASCADRNGLEARWR